MNADTKLKRLGYAQKLNLVLIVMAIGIIICTDIKLVETIMYYAIVILIVIRLVLMGIIIYVIFNDKGEEDSEF